MLDLVPWRPMRELRREIDRLFEDFFGERALATETDWIPSVDISETKDAVIIKAELPGLDPEDIDISLRGDILTIKGEKKQEVEEKDENFHRIERRYGFFSRSIRIPAEVDPERIEASYRRGVLKVVLPKKEEARVKQIPVKTE
ncbi:Hsp20/alpha crystallin family protein [Thermosulfuriphilus sp.]